MPTDPQMVQLRQDLKGLLIPTPGMVLIALSMIATIVLSLEAGSYLMLSFVGPDTIPRFGWVRFSIVSACCLTLAGAAASSSNRICLKLNSRGVLLAFGMLAALHAAGMIRGLGWGLLGFLGMTPLFGLGAILAGLARQQMAPSAREKTARDRRPAVLYLRSFKYDDTVAGGHYDFLARSRERIEGISLFHLLRPSFWRPLTLEEVICKGLNAAGPVVAIGRPGEPLPKLGAAREYCSDSEWQDRVRDWVGSCHYVALLIGKTEGLAWESELVLNQTDGRRILLLIPPDDRHTLDRINNTAPDNQGIWPKFLGNCVGLEFRDRLPETLGQDALGISFSKDWRPIIIRGEPTIGNYRRIARLMVARLK